MEYCIISDDEGHNFVVPHNRKEDGMAYLTKLANHFSEGEMDVDPAPMPEWMKEIDGIHTLIFKEWRKVC